MCTIRKLGEGKEQKTREVKIIWISPLKIAIAYHNFNVPFSWVIDNFYKKNYYSIINNSIYYHYIINTSQKCYMCILLQYNVNRYIVVVCLRDLLKINFNTIYFEQFPLSKLLPDPPHLPTHTTPYLFSLSSQRHNKKEKAD